MGFQEIHKHVPGLMSLIVVATWPLRRAWGLHPQPLAGHLLRQTGHWKLIKSRQAHLPHFWPAWFNQPASDWPVLWARDPETTGLLPHGNSHRNTGQTSKAAQILSWYGLISIDMSTHISKTNLVSLSWQLKEHFYQLTKPTLRKFPLNFVSSYLITNELALLWIISWHPCDSDYLNH